MKHGSHIMLQRFVRSIVSTAPRPYLIDEVPWLCRLPAAAQIVAAREEPLEPLQERRVDRQRVGERAVHRAGLLDDDPAVALEDVAPDLADVLVDQRLDRLLAGQDARRAPRGRRPDTANRSSAASRAPASCAPRSSAAVPAPTSGWNVRAVDPAIDELQCWPRQPCSASEYLLERPQHVHPVNLRNDTTFLAANSITISMIPWLPPQADVSDSEVLPCYFRFSRSPIAGCLLCSAIAPRNRHRRPRISTTRAARRRPGGRAGRAARAAPAEPRRPHLQGHDDVARARSSSSTRG